MSPLKKRWMIGLLALVVGFTMGAVNPFHLHPREGSWEVYEEGKYEFINPLLSCGEGSFNHLGNDESMRLESRLETMIAGMKTQGKISDAGVYFRELNGGPWLGVNYDAEFAPGSLLKVPLAISVYQLSEGDPDLLSREITFEGAIATAEQHFAGEPLTEGATYSVEELVRRALVYSDNTSALLLAQIIGIGEVEESYKRLGVTVPTSGQDYSTSVRTYASFFRILYNATYLDRKNSERLLSYLSESTFENGLVAGLPPGTKIAHKFGERAVTGEPLVQLHDCGIVYHPKQPYLLCVMMRGRDFDTIAGAIADISKLVYDHVE